MPDLFRMERTPVPILVEDPDLAADLDEATRRRAEHVVRARPILIGAGRWHAERDLPRTGSPGDLGLLVVDGLLVRGLDLHGAACAEVIGTGDVIRPWDTGPELTLSRSTTWDAVAPALLAVLDRPAMAAMSQWPEIVARLIDRVFERSHRLAFHLAVCGLPRVDLRLLAVMWNMADRWGRVTPDGVVLPLPLTHRVLGQLIAIRRPSVTSHLGQLRSRGLVMPRDDGGWLLGGDPPVELAEIRSQLVAQTVPPPAAAGAEG